MKKLMVVLALAATASGAHATTFTFYPDDNSGSNKKDMFDLDHHYAYTWGVRFDIPTGDVITGAKLEIANIWDWKVENDMLFMRLINDPWANNTRLVRTIADNTADNVIADYFVGQGVPLTTWTDPKGGSNGAYAINFSYDFNAAQIAALTGFINDGRPNDTSSKKYGDFGIAFDPDCHYFNDGVTLTITTEHQNVPDGGATAVLAGAAMLAVAAVRRRLA